MILLVPGTADQATMHKLGHGMFKIQKASVKVVFYNKIHGIIYKGIIQCASIYTSVAENILNCIT
jgi:hypothetical protein